MESYQLLCGKKMRNIAREYKTWAQIYLNLLRKMVWLKSFVCTTVCFCVWISPNGFYLRWVVHHFDCVDKKNIFPTKNARWTHITLLLIAVLYSNLFHLQSLNGNLCSNYRLNALWNDGVANPQLKQCFCTSSSSFSSSFYYKTMTRVDSTFMCILFICFFVIPDVIKILFHL